MKLTIEMPNRNRAWFLDRSIPLIAKQTLNQDEWELIITDDGSIDESEQIIQKYKKMNIIKNFHFIKNTKKRNDGQGSPAIACNIVAKMCSGDYLLHTDPEIMPLPTWAEQHYLAHEGKTDRHVWGECLHPREYHIINDGFGKEYKGHFLGNAYTDYNWSNIEETWKKMNDKIKEVQNRYKLSDGAIKNEFFNDWQAGFSISRKLLFDIRGYEEDFCNKSLGLDKYGGDDLIIFHHLNNAGSQKIINNKAMAIHVYHKKDDALGNVQSTYAWKYIESHPKEYQANLGREWGEIEKNGYIKVF